MAKEATPAEGSRMSSPRRAKLKRTDVGFVAPDGGWGWWVVLAAGCSNLSTFPVLQQFGLLFRDRLTDLGLSGKEITTIINLNSCVTSCLGLLNGPMFRRFSYRQVAFCGALLSACGVFCTAYASSFLTFALTFSFLYGAGTGINQSANSLALNTYFKEKRRIATGISWTATALGPILFPQIIALLVPIYGVQGTVLIFGAIALNAVGLAMIYQPVEWHTQDPEPDAEEANQALNSNGDLCQFCADNRANGQAIAGYEIVDPGTPMLSAANDGWFSSTPAKRSLYSSRVSLASGFTSRKTSSANFAASSSRKPSFNRLNSLDVDDPPTDIRSNRTSSANLAKEAKQKTKTAKLNRLNSKEATEEVPATSEIRANRSSSVNLAKEAKRDALKAKTAQLKIEEAEVEDCPSYKAPQDLRADRQSQEPAAVPELNSPPAEPHRPMFAINDGFKPKSSMRQQTKPLEVNGANAFDEQLMTAAANGWLQPKSSMPSRSQSVLSIFDMTPRRNYSTVSFQAQAPEKQVLRDVRHQLEQYVTDSEGGSQDQLRRCTCREGRKDEEEAALADADEQKYSCWQKVFIFFDLDLLRDWSYVNLMVGVTIASFAELNYSILTPFVLAEYGLSKVETATSMSLLGACDISVRFFVPFIAGRIGWENKTFFLFGVLGMALGRISIAHFHTYPAVLAASVWIGLNKGLRTVFMALVIPSYVPLARLPGATGLQLLFAGIFYFLVGPVIGWIRDTTNYTVTLHCLNIATFTTAICWGAEKWMDVRRERRERRMVGKDVANGL